MRVPLTAANLWKQYSARKGLFLIAGPCVVDKESVCLRVAEHLVRTCSRLRVPYTFKASFDKANRTSGGSFRGPGLDAGLRVLAKVKREFGVPVLTDIHKEGEAAAVAEVADVIQIPAFLCRQTDLIAAAAATGRILNIKKGQFLAPGDMAPVLDKARAAGAQHVLITERGTTFGYNNLVADMRAIPMMRNLGVPVVFDATHSVQLPGGAGDRSSGQREFAPVLARAAVAAGASGVFVETHPNPDQSPSDGPNMIPLDDMAALLKRLVQVRQSLE